MCALVLCSVCTFRKCMKSRPQIENIHQHACSYLVSKLLNADTLHGGLGFRQDHVTCTRCISGAFPAHAYRHVLDYTSGPAHAYTCSSPCIDDSHTHNHGTIHPPCKQTILSSLLKSLQMTWYTFCLHETRS